MALKAAIEMFMNYGFDEAYDRLERCILAANSDVAASRLAAVQDALCEYNDNLNTLDWS
jgi:hypothetical protein